MSFLDRVAAPKTAGFVDPASGQVLDWSAIRTEVAARAARLPTWATRPRAVVGVCGQNGVDTLATVFAIIEAGGVPAPFPPATSEQTRLQCLDALGASASWTSWGGWTNLAGDASMSTGFDIVMHTSGSTARPKPMAIRLDAMVRNARDVASILNLGPDDVHLGTMSHCYMSGLYNATVLPFVVGARTIPGPIIGIAQLSGFVESIRRDRPTVVWLNPLVCNMLVRLASVPSDLFQGVRHLVSCTAPLGATTKEAFELKFSVQVLQSYGLSETLITTVETPDAPAPGTVGRPVGHRGAVRISEDGEIIVANGAHFCGYLDPMPSSPSLSPPSEFATGDLGRFDANGNLVVEGRIGGVINRGGVKISNAIIEAAFSGYRGIDEVAVVGRPSGDQGDEIVAFVVAEHVDQGALFALLVKRLDRHQVPDRVIVVGELPRTPNGKIDLKQLRMWAANDQ